VKVIVYIYKQIIIILKFKSTQLFMKNKNASTDELIKGKISNTNSFWR